MTSPCRRRRAEALLSALSLSLCALYLARFLPTSCTLARSCIYTYIYIYISLPVYTRVYACIYTCARGGANSFLRLLLSRRLHMGVYIRCMCVCTYAPPALSAPPYGAAAAAASVSLSLLAERRCFLSRIVHVTLSLSRTRAQWSGCAAAAAASPLAPLYARSRYSLVFTRCSHSRSHAMQLRYLSLFSRVSIYLCIRLICCCTREQHGHERMRSRDSMCARELCLCLY